MLVCISPTVNEPVLVGTCAYVKFDVDVPGEEDHRPAVKPEESSVEICSLIPTEEVADNNARYERCCNLLFWLPLHDLSNAPQLLPGLLRFCKRTAIEGERETGPSVLCKWGHRSARCRQKDGKHYQYTLENVTLLLDHRMDSCH